MVVAHAPFQLQTAQDLMTPTTRVIPHAMCLRSAADLLVQAQLGAAPVVDEDGRCIGILSGSDFLSWVAKWAPGIEDESLGVCPFQRRNSVLPTGHIAQICMLSEGVCRWQTIQSTTAGANVALCQLPSGVVSDFQKTADVPLSAVCRYMAADLVTVSPEAPVPELVQTMVETGAQHLIVVDNQRRPIGIVAAVDLLAAVAQYGAGAETVSSQA